jgi:acetyl-CoA synthetase
VPAFPVGYVQNQEQLMKISTSSIPPPVRPNLEDYESSYGSFNWKEPKLPLPSLTNGVGLNIAFEAVERHAHGDLAETIALRCIRPDKSFRDFTYGELNRLSSRFANVLAALGVKKGERVFALAGRLPELYTTALGTLKSTAVFCPLFSVFGPEPVFQRLSRGDAKVLVTSKALFEKKVKQLLDRLPTLKFVILIDEEAHIDERVRSLPRLMEAAGDDFFIPHTNPEDPALLHFTSGLPVCQKEPCTCTEPC